MPRPVTCLLALSLAAACTGSDPVASPSPSATSPSPAVTTGGPPSPSAAATTARPVDPGPPWPKVGRSTQPPPALGAVETVRIAARSDGGTLAAGLVLPRLGGSEAAPVVMTPCGDRVTLRAPDVRAIPPGGGSLPKRPADVLVVIDPGHGGAAAGARGADGTPEKERVLQIAREVRSALRGRVGRVVMTRDRDMEAGLPFRVALADALRADVAVSVHLNAEPDLTRATPGLETYGSVADPAGRRLAGVIYEAQRRYLDTLGGPWAADRDAGAKYRIGRDGRDYYGLLRRAHRPWVISESMFISNPREAGLVARADVRSGLGRAIADGITAFTTTTEPGSGWVTPYPRPADPGAGAAPPCRDPSR